MKIIRKTGQFVSLFILSVMCVMLLSDQSVRATEVEYSCDVNIPVEVKVSGSDITTGVKYEVNLEAVTEGAPMPETTTLTFTDAGTAEFGTMTYTVPGDYVYTITQTKGSQDRCTYDETVYTVTVRVVNDSENGGLVSEVWAVKDGGTDKTSSIVFTNKYAAKPAETTDTEVTNDTDDTYEDPGVPMDDTSDPEPGDPGVQTGDAANLALYAVIMLAAFAAIIILLIFRRKGRTE